MFHFVVLKLAIIRSYYVTPCKCYPVDFKKMYEFIQNIEKELLSGKMFPRVSVIFMLKAEFLN